MTETPTRTPTNEAGTASSLLKPTPVLTFGSRQKPVLTSGDNRDLFRAILEGVAAFPELGVVSNRFPWQAKMAVEKLLEVAKRKKLPIRVISGRAPEGFYDTDFVTKIKECHRAGCKFIRILVWQADSTGISPALMQLAEHGIVELRACGTPKHTASVPHFFLVGESAFRQEAAHPPFDEKTVISETHPQVPARIDFNDPRTGKILATFFDQLWEKRE